MVNEVRRLFSSLLNLGYNDINFSHTISVLKCHCILSAFLLRLLFFTDSSFMRRKYKFMNKSKVFFIIGIAMVIFMVLFLIYAFQHPEKSFRLSIRMTHTIYCSYLILMIVIFVLSYITRNK